MKAQRIIKTNPFGFTLTKSPMEMTKVELLEELNSRLKSEKKLKAKSNERGILIHELELHQLELEIQNRELLESHKQIEDSRNKFAELYDLAPAGYITLDNRGRIIELNLTAAKMLMEERSMLIGRIFSRWLHSEFKAAFGQHISEASGSLEERSLCNVELVTKGRPGTLHVQLHTQSATDPLTSRPIFRVAIMDMSAMRKADELEAKNREMYDEKGLRENFVATLSHDLRTPLTSSKLCAQLLLGEKIETPKRNRLLGMLVEELDRADKMVTDLLNANKINGKNIPLVKKRCDLHLVAQKCIDTLRSVYPGVMVEYMSKGTLTGVWSKDALRRVIENLFHNARKYGSKETPITLSLEGLDDKVILAVHNFGNPISKRDLKKIFEAFQRGRDTAECQTSWGLGLNMVHNMITNHGGTISVKSNINDGTFFIIELPKKASRAES